MMKKNIFLTGPPSSGKTTVIKKILEKLASPAKGFYTEEERKGDRRIGFLMKTLDGRQGYLAHENITSTLRIRRFGVSIQNVDQIAVPSIKPETDTVIILDEIGKMECFSNTFKHAVIEALQSTNIVIGTITLGGDGFIREVKRRDDIDIIEVTPENRDSLPCEILKRIEKLRN